ncbi:hypothetical protein SERLADRAFT_404579 [Serpula lacrymans var. lacrymans S7.9]|uniref:Uncharacterized protein n=1 Tax=Serpula lacrymans var. lacrymans (strain S7.9) TaxID=578457 RepID=F8NE56_SERL9|nr:uncharacterized protein SERLADRAFT_404579 [Serpula lacrymans var. lacrymans S7.9]EGO30385.1 hypothetical protein SERLADRAFT_404579 [Serpula lacrymans var. lacrymans S7.9]
MKSNKINNNTLYPLCIRIQGILEKSLLSALGSWDGTLHFALSATQNIMLGSGPFKDQWESLLLAIHKLCQLVHISLGENGYTEPPITAMCSLYMQRQVFSKITATHCKVSLALHATNNPSHKADLINDKWRVLQKITLARKDLQGKVVSCSHTLFWKGDFVDVATKRNAPTNSPAPDELLAKKSKTSGCVDQQACSEHVATTSADRLYREKQEDNVHSKAMRIRNFVNYSNSENYTYSIKQLPPINAWGVKKHNKDWSHYICHPRSNTPYTIWVVGLISKVWFFAPGPNGAPHPQVPYKNLRKVQKPMIGVILTSWPGTIKLLFTDKEIIKQCFRLSPSQPATMLVTRSLKNATWRPIPLTV